MAGVVTGTGAGEIGGLPRLSEAEAYALPPLALAYVGDAVWELAVRQALVLRGERRPRRLHSLAVEYVRAGGQAERLRALMPHLAEREADIVRRGRGAKPGNAPKGVSGPDYRASTGLEALLGYLFLTGGGERLQHVIALLMAGQEERAHAQE